MRLRFSLATLAAMAGAQHGWCGFDKVRGLRYERTNTLYTLPEDFRAGERHTCLVQVRRDFVAAYNWPALDHYPSRWWTTHWPSGALPDRNTWNGRRSEGVAILPCSMRLLAWVRIMTNNPKKIYGIEGYGLTVVEEVPIRMSPGEHNRKYLETKKAKMGHRS